MFINYCGDKMKIEYKSYKKPTYYVAKQTVGGFEFIGLSGRSTIELAKRDAKKFAKSENYPNYVIVKVLGKIGYF